MKNNFSLNGFCLGVYANQFSLFFLFHKGMDSLFNYVLLACKLYYIFTKCPKLKLTRFFFQSYPNSSFLTNIVFKLILVER